MWKTSHWQLCYLDHVINLVVQVFLFHNMIEMKKLKSYNELKKSEDFEDEIKWKFQLLEFLDKLHNIIVSICSSADCTAEFLKLADRMISLDNCTRWNSWYSSLIVADKHASFINTYIKSYFNKLFKDYLTSLDWKKLHTIMIFL